jgi:hypothetical protein
MIKILTINNFKSIKQLKLNCKRVNLFIGKPNVGKSNLLEAVGIFSLPYLYDDIKGILRFENMANLFYDQEVSEKIEITANGFSFGVKFQNGSFKAIYEDREKKNKGEWDFGYDGKKISSGGYSSWDLPPFKAYKFMVKDSFFRAESDFLLPTKGENLLQILLTKKEIRKFVAGLFSEYGLKLVLKPQEHKMEVQKEIEDVIISYPYSLVSDTLQRVVFHFLAIETNKDSILIFEEPEAHAFPYYTKFLAERISLDSSNQYFISTHNPYFLLSVLEKTPIEDVRIFITYFKDYQTKVKPLTEKEMPAVLDLDASVFFNLDRFLGEG